MKSRDKIMSYVSAATEYLIFFLKWTFLGILVGTSGGVVGTLFSKSVEYVTEIRNHYNWIIYLLPIGGLIITFIYRLCRVKDIGTNEVFEGVRTEKKVPVLLAPAVFSGSVITHLLGGSAGREGAALQLGGSIASFFGKYFKLNDKDRHIIIMCGMSGVFSAVFGTPLCAAVFAVEVVSVGYMYSSALFPCITSSVTSYYIGLKLGIKPERFYVHNIPDLNLATILQVLIIAISGAIISIIFCQAMHITSKLFKRYFKNSYLRAVVGGCIIIILTLIFNTNDYNGGGINIIERIFEHGEVRYEAFLLKIVFTAITIGSGFKGGEIVPTLFIGATLGASISLLIGSFADFGAAIGMAAMFCGVTNCPIATVLLAAELFGSEGLLFYATAAILSFLLSGYSSLYHGQKIIFSKLNEDIININAK